MLKMKDLLQEGRNIQETFKKRMSINEGSAVITVPVEDSYDQYGEGEYFQELLKKKGIKSTFEQKMGDIELTVDKKDAKKAVAILSNAGYAPTLNVVVGKNVQTVGKTNLPSSAKGGSVVLNIPVFGGSGAYGAKDEANFALEVLKKKGIKAQIVKSTFDDEFSLKVAKADAKKAIQVLSDNGMEIEEGRKIQEKFKKNVVREATTKSKFTPLLSVRDNGDSATLVTPFGSITIETPGEYDTFNSYSDPSLSYTNPKRGISQSEWRRIASDIFDYATSERNYRKALEKLLDPKVLAKYIPKIKTVVETVNNNVVTEEITRKYRDEVNKEYIALASKVRKIGQFTFEPSKKGPSQWGATTKSGDGDLVVFFKPFSHPETGETQPKFEVSVWNVYPNSQGIESKFGGSSFANPKYMKPLTPTDDPKKDAKLAFDYIKTFLNSPDLARTLKSLR